MSIKEKKFEEYLIKNIHLDIFGSNFDILKIIEKIFDKNNFIKKIISYIDVENNIFYIVFKYEEILFNKKFIRYIILNQDIDILDNLIKYDYICKKELFDLFQITTIN